VLRIPKIAKGGVTQINQKKNAIILDDDEVTCRLLRNQLISKGFLVNYFLKSKDLFEYLNQGMGSDVFILDYALMEDKLCGLDVCRKLKSKYQCPVVMLTGNKSAETIVSCIAAGADLYIEKPYELESLVARIGAISRVYEILKPQDNNKRKSNLELDNDIFVNHTQRLIQSPDGQSVSLTDKELAFYELITSREALFISREEAYLGIYGRSMDPSNRAIDNLACRVRAKLKKINVRLELRVIRGVGYRVVNLNAAA